MTDKTDTDRGLKALEAYLKDCDDNAIVPDVGGAFHAAFMAGRASAGFTAADMATASAQGFRDGVASLSAAEPAQADETMFHFWRAANMPEATESEARAEWAIASQAAIVAAQQIDPMDWPLPCDVTVGHGTMGKGVSLRTLVSRMKVLYEMATGNNADEVANRTPEQNTALSQAFIASAAPTLTQGAAIAAGAVYAELPDVDLVARGMGWEDCEVLMREACAQTGVEWGEEKKPQDIAINVMMRLANAAHKAGFTLGKERMAAASHGQAPAQPAATVIKRGADREWMSERLGHLPDGIYSLYLATPSPQAAPLEFTKEWCMAAAKAEEDSGADISAGVPVSPQAAQQAPDPGPQSATVEEAARHVGKWLNERPNRPLDLRDVAMLVAHAQQAPSTPASGGDEALTATIDRLEGENAMLRGQLEASGKHSHQCRACNHDYTPPATASEDCPLCGFDGIDTHAGKAMKRVLPASPTIEGESNG